MVAGGIEVGRAGGEEGCPKFHGREEQGVQPLVYSLKYERPTVCV